jgi:hypothetical protein
VEAFAQMHDLRALLALNALREILADLPVECRLERVLDAEGAAFDEEHVFVQRRRNGQSRKRFDELGHVGGVDVRVRRFVDRRVRDAIAKLRRVHLRVVVADRYRREVREEVEHVAAAARIE